MNKKQISLYVKKTLYDEIKYTHGKIASVMKKLAELHRLLVMKGYTGRIFVRGKGVEVWLVDKNMTLYDVVYRMQELVEKLNGVKIIIDISKEKV